ncbi:hypothetical protein SAMN05660350_04312 [Geodermatophilus obscurus]|uniref:Uncharacterized protein n=1 Tax=Geodermatophilus obscurus TaxID=1861 RepID=A0A1M7UYI0_9ACTN|nr:hypothetical protein SAMN05660350_04312 [Geodermatophilus obscurus]
MGAALIAAATGHTDRSGAPGALLTETADRYFVRFGFISVERDRLPVTLAGSDQLQGAFPDSAQEMLRPPDHGHRH